MKKQTGRRKALQNASANQRAFFKSISFEDFLRNNANKEGLSGSEFRLVISEETKDGTISVYCHPFGRDGETYDAYIWHFNIEPKQAIDNLVKFMREKPV